MRAIIDGNGENAVHVAIEAVSGVSVRIDGTPQKLKPSEREVLGILTMASVGGTGWPVDLLVEWLWPGERPEDPKRALHIRVAGIRKRLGPNAKNILVTDRESGSNRAESYRLVPDACSIDLHDWFTAIQEAERNATNDPEHARRRYQQARMLWPPGQKLLPFLTAKSIEEDQPDPVEEERKRLRATRTNAILAEAALMTHAGNPEGAADLLCSEASVAGAEQRIVGAAVHALRQIGRTEDARQLQNAALGTAEPAVDHQRVLGSTEPPSIPLLDLRDEDHPMLFLAALMPAPIRVDTVATSLGIAREDAVQSFERSEDAGVLRPTDAGAWEWTDPQHRDQAHRLFSGRERRQRSKAVADRLIGADARADMLAPFMIAAGDLMEPQEVIRVCANAGAICRDGGRYPEAAELFLHAARRCENGPRGPHPCIHRLHHAEAELLADNDEEADRFLVTLMDAAARLGDWDMVADAALAGTAHVKIGGSHARRDRLWGAHTHLPPDHARRGEVAAELAMAQVRARDPLDKEVFHTLRRHLQTPASTGQLLAVRALVVIEEIENGAAVIDPHRLGEESLRRLIRAAPESAESSEATTGLDVAVHVALSRGDTDTASTWSDALDTHGRARGIRRAEWRATTYRAAVADLTDQNTSLNLAEAARDRGAELEQPDAAKTYEIFERAHDYLSGSTARWHPEPDIPPQFRQSVTPVLRGHAAWASGDRDEAQFFYRDAIEDLARKRDVFRTPALAMLFDLAARLGTVDGLTRLIDETHGYEGREGTLVFLGWGGPFLGPFDWFLSRRAIAFGDNAEAVRYGQSAADLCRRRQVRWSPPPRE